MKALRAKCCVFCVGLMLASGLSAQKSLPNPLIQPPKRGMPGAVPPGSPEGAAGEGAAASAATTASREAGKEGDPAMTEVLNRVGTLYVSAIIGDVAVLRATSGAPVAGGPAGGGSSAGASGGPPAAAVTGKPPVYFVRDAEPFQIFDRYRLLPRIHDATVLLYLLPDNPQDLTRRPQIVFRANLDSGMNPPYVPSKLEAPGSGDGTAYQGLISTGAGQGGGAKPVAPTSGTK